MSEIRNEIRDVKWLPIADVKENPRNRNKHPEHQLRHLAKIIRAHGFRHPLIVSSRSGLLVSGHGRLAAARLLGLPTVPVATQDFASEAEEYQFGVADNAIALQAEIDIEGIVADMPTLGVFDHDLLGIADFEIPKTKSKLTDPDEVPEPPANPKSRLGDLFILGSHRLLCGDSTSQKDVERLMSGSKASMWQSDPPYGISYVDKVAQEKGQAEGYAPIANDELQDEALKDFIFKSIEISKPFLKTGFAFYMWHAMKMQAYFSQAAAAAAGILFHRQIIWVKPQFVFGRGHYHWRHELCLMGWLQGHEPPFYGERNQSTVWEIGRENDKIHPTQKPVAIWEAPILNHTKPNEIIYEPFAGSGSQIIACEKLSRRCFAMELEPQYVDVIVARWQAYTGLQATLEDGTPFDRISR